MYLKSEIYINLLLISSLFKFLGLNVILAVILVYFI